MNDLIAIEILKSEKWTEIDDEIGDAHLEMQINHKIITITPSIKTLNNSYLIGFMPALSTDEFRSFVRHIRKANTLAAPLAIMQWKPRKMAEISKTDFISMIEEIINWSTTIDIKNEINRHAQLPTNTKGAMPVRHLAALALLGDTEKLEFYKRAFKAGNRLDFVPYISIEMIERALEIARMNGVCLPR